MVNNCEINGILNQLALSYGLGSFIITIQLFVLFFVLKLSYANYFYILIILEIIILIFFVLKKNISLINYKIDFSIFKRIKALEVIFLLLIITQVVLLLSNALAKPTIVYDSLSIWAWRAKILFYEGAVNFTPGDFLYLGGEWHINYPWHVPLQQFWFHLNLGEYNDLLVNLVFVFYYLSILIILYYALKNYINRARSLLFVFLLSSMSLIFYHGFNAYADLVLSFYVLVSLIYLFSWFQNRNKRDFILSAIFISITFFVKIEGIIFIISSITIILLYLLFNKFYNKKEKLKLILYYFIAIIGPILPWLYINVKYKLGIRNIGPGLGFHPEIFKSFFAALFMSNSWNIWWFIVIIVLAVKIKKIIKDKELFYGWLYLFLSTIGFVAIYLFTNNYRFALDYTAIGRNILTLVPISVLVAAISLKNNINNNKL